MSIGVFGENKDDKLHANDVAVEQLHLLTWANYIQIV